MRKLNHTLGSPLIAIGASAGALVTLEQFFSTVPPSTPYAFVVIQHLSPNHKSMMDELLARKTDLPIVVIQNGLTLKKGHIYLNPPKQLIGLENNSFIVSKQPLGEVYPISFFLEALASNRKESCAVIIFSGMGSDGSDGIRAIKEAGGFSIAQDPEEATFNGMPSSAIQTGEVDLVCDTGRMYEACNQFFQFQLKTVTNTLEQSKIYEIVQLLKTELDQDFSGYEQTTLTRRVSRRMGILGLGELDDYLTHLKTNKKALVSLSDDLMIGVSNFFRDMEAFEALESKALPDIFEQAKTRGEIRVLVTTCSTGEEAYSLAILILEGLRKRKLSLGLTVFATDINYRAVKSARNPLFSAPALNHLDDKLVSAYFTLDGKGYRPNKKLRDLIVFSSHDLLSGPPFSKIDLVSCRNLLIYLKPELQQQFLHVFRFSLRQDGILFLGSGETIGKLSNYYETVSAKWQIYRNRHHVNLMNLSSKFNLNLSGKNNQAIKKEIRSLKPLLHENSTPDIKRLLIQHYAPDALVYDQKNNLLYVTGNAGRYIETRPGIVGQKLQDLLPERWIIALDVATSNAREKNKSVLVKNFTKGPDDVAGTSVRVDLIKNDLTDEGNLIFAAVFLNSETLKPQTHDIDIIENLDIDSEIERKITRLEYNLRFNKESHQSTIEEMESSNEELESVNEELNTIIAEYQKKTEELSTSNNDLNNLLHSTNIAIIFLDHELKIRRFTSPIKRVLNLVNDDVGRSISDFSGTFPFTKYKSEFLEVMETLRPLQISVERSDGSIYALQVTPLKTSKNEVEGVVLSLLDITQLKEAQLKLAKTRGALQQAANKSSAQKELHELIEEHLSDLICIHDRDGVYQYVSPSVKNLLGYSGDELIGKTPYDFFYPEDQVRVWEESHKKVLDKQKNVIEYRMKKADGSYTWLETTNQFITDSKGRVSKILTTSRDVSHHKELENRLKQFSKIVENTKNAVCILDKEGRYAYSNNSYLKLTGYNHEELNGSMFMDLIRPDGNHQNELSKLRKAFSSKVVCDVEIVNTTLGGNPYWVNIILQPLTDTKGQLSGFFSVQQDITKLKEQELGLTGLNKSLEEHNNKLEEANQELQDFTYIVSHDLKEPIRGVKGLLGLIKDKSEAELTQKDKDYIDLAIENTARMGNMIDTMLEYSRFGAKDVATSPIALKNVVEKVIRGFYSVIKENSASIKVNLDGVIVQGYKTSLARLFQNLISNALKYRSEQPPVIQITAEEVQQQWIIRVKDNGIGIKDSNKEKVFQLFNKVSSRSYSSGSHGVGLAICKQIVKAHEGTINLESEHGNGTTFIITLLQGTINKELS